MFEAESGKLPDRTTFRKEVREVEQRLLEQAYSRRAQVAARRMAIEAVLLRYGLFREMADVSTKLNAESVTNELGATLEGNANAFSLFDLTCA